MGYPVIEAPQKPPTGALLNCSSATVLSTVTTQAYLWVTNLGATTLTLGASGVTSGAGIGLPAGAGVCLRVDNPSLWYGIGSSSVQAATTQEP